jgi:hypothetical protein
LGIIEGRRQKAQTETQVVRQAMGEQWEHTPRPAAAEANRHMTDKVREVVDLIMQENMQSTANTCIPSRNRTQEEQVPTAESDRSSIMQWSPVKLVGNKRTLEDVGEAEDTPGESEEERKEGKLSEGENLEDSDVESHPASPALEDRFEKKQCTLGRRSITRAN